METAMSGTQDGGAEGTEDAQQVHYRRGNIKKMSSSELFSQGQQLQITHGKEVYMLRITKQDKLILTK